MDLRTVGSTIHPYLRKGLDRARRYYELEGPAMAARRLSYDVYAQALAGAWAVAGEDYGESIWDRDWEVLIVLDACRADLMDEVADEYDFLEPHTSMMSVGSNSGQWMTRTFAPEYRDEMADTAVVTGNPHSSTCIDGDDLALLDEVWRYAWEDDDELFRANYVADRAIDVWRTHRPERMIVHFMQPHLPFIPHFDGFESELHRGFYSQWRDIRTGDADRDVMWSQYRDNLHYVLEYVDRLLDSIDADDVVISADHGEAVGEYGIYGHDGIPLRVLRQVPWVETTARDTGEYVPSFQPDPDAVGLATADATAADGDAAADDPATGDESAEEQVREQLAMLGYME